MFTLYDYQQDAYDAAVDNISQSLDDSRGRFVMPTGAGKTIVQASILDWQIQNNSKSGVHLVLAPRIMLGNQLLGEYKQFLGVQSFRAIAFHSGEHVAEDGVKWKETATTQKDVVVQAIEDAQKLNVPLVGSMRPSLLKHQKPQLQSLDLQRREQRRRARNHNPKPLLREGVELKTHALLYPAEDPVSTRRNLVSWYHKQRWFPDRLPLQTP